MKICDFDRQFLSSYHICSALLKMTKESMSFNSLDPDLYDYAKITFIHSVINNDMPKLDYQVKNFTLKVLLRMLSYLNFRITSFRIAKL